MYRAFFGSPDFQVPPPRVCGQKLACFSFRTPYVSPFNPCTPPSFLLPHLTTSLLPGGELSLAIAVDHPGQPSQSPPLPAFFDVPLAKCAQVGGFFIQFTTQSTQYTFVQADDSAAKCVPPIFS